MDKRQKIRRPQRGFSLIELMIVVVIVGILASIAYPSYAEYVMRGNRQAARSALLQIADRQEQFFLDNKRYAGDLAELNMGAETVGIDRDGQIVDADGDDLIYSVTFDDADDTSWTLSAEPLNNQADRDTDCATLTLASTGERGNSAGGENCW